jgi:hypothetical protein
MTASTHLNDTKNFGQIDPGKNPSVGKTSEREGVLLISSILEITLAKIKTNRLLISSSNSVHEFD